MKLFLIARATPFLPSRLILQRVKMANDLSRDDMDGLIAQTRRVLIVHYGDVLETARARNELEQILSSAAGQLSEEGRRAVAGFAERLISAVWSESISISAACVRVEHAAHAAMTNSETFRKLIAG